MTTNLLEIFKVTFHLSVVCARWHICGGQRMAGGHLSCPATARGPGDGHPAVRLGGRHLYLPSAPSHWPDISTTI